MSEPFDGEIGVRGILWVGLGLALLIVISAAAMWGVSSWLIERGEASDPPPPVLVEARRPVEISGPILQTDPVGEIVALRDEEHEALESWAWADETAGIARIPVERAMELYLDGARAGQPIAAAPATASEAETANDAETANAAASDATPDGSEPPEAGAGGEGR